MRYLLPIITGIAHLTKKFDRAVLMHVVKTVWKKGFVYEVFCSLALFSKREWSLQAR